MTETVSHERQLHNFDFFDKDAHAFRLASEQFDTIHPIHYDIIEEYPELAPESL